MPSYERLPKESSGFLSMTTVFQIAEGGAIEQITLSKEEPDWSINFKKALVVLFQTKTGETSSLESNTVS